MAGASAGTRCAGLELLLQNHFLGRRRDLTAARAKSVSVTGNRIADVQLHATKSRDTVAPDTASRMRNTIGRKGVPAS
eukprot:3941930-Rhodomonas_salina.27